MDRLDWIPLGELEIGEQVVSNDGPLHLVSRVAHNQPTDVFNIEVDCEHVYQVGDAGVLVHNAYIKHSEILGESLSSGAANPQEFAKRMRALGYQAAHIIPSSTWAKSNNISQVAKDAISDAHDLLKRVGIDIDKFGNGFWAKPRHLGSHTDDFFRQLGRSLEGLSTHYEVELALLELKRMLQSGKFR